MRRVFFFAVILFALAPFARAMTSTNYSISWDAVGSGGTDTGTSTNYSIFDTVAQPPAGSGTSTSYLTTEGYRYNSSSAAIPNGGNGGGGQGGGGAGGNDPPPRDVTPPVISDIRVIDITAAGATVTWTTNEAANSTVTYGTTLLYEGGTQSVAALNVIHSIKLVGLQAGTTYHYQVLSTDAAGNRSSSSDLLFTTQAAGPLLILNARVESITEHAAQVVWDTNVVAEGFVEYGVTHGYGLRADAPVASESQRVSLVGLAANTTYHYRITATDARAGTTKTQDAFFVTLADTTAPANPFGFVAVARNGSADLAWVLPPDVDLSSIIIVSRTDRYPMGPNDGRIVYQGLGTFVKDGGLINGVTYYYTAYSVDTTGNTSSGARASARPAGSVQPPPLPPPLPPPTKTTTTDPNGNNNGLSGEDKTADGDRSTGSSTSTPGKPTEPTTSSTSTPDVAVSTSTVLGTESASSGPPVPAIKDNVTPSGRLKIDFFDGQSNVPLATDARGRWIALPGRSISIRVLDLENRFSATEGTVRIGRSLYALAPQGDGSWVATFVPGLGEGSAMIVVTIRHANGTQSVSTANLRLREWGLVYEPTLLGKKLPIAAAQLTLLSRGSLWAGGLYGQSNPIESSTKGAYAFGVPPGSYVLRAEKDGYETWERIVVPLGAYIVEDVPLMPSATGAAAILSDVIKGLDAIRTPGAIAVSENIVTPAVITVALANTATATQAANVLNYLRFLFTQPFLLLGRRRRKPWGVVYNALSRAPVELAVVRLLRADSGLQIQSSVTDAKGRFSFLVPSGRYRLQVVKPGFLYPTEILKAAKTDLSYTDVYHGEEIEVKADVTLTVNIPLDPLSRQEVPRKIVIRLMLRRVQAVVGLLGLFVAFGALIIAPSWIMLGFFVAQILLYFIFRRLAIPPRPKDWGIVYETGSKKALDRTVVRIFNKRFNKLLETQVTGKDGKYHFAVGKDIYYVTAEKHGYQRFQSHDLDLTQEMDDKGMIREEIQMNKESGQ